MSINIQRTTIQQQILTLLDRLPIETLVVIERIVRLLYDRLPESKTEDSTNIETTLLNIAYEKEDILTRFDNFLTRMTKLNANYDEAEILADIESIRTELA
jgi:hypothetical protein